MLLTATPWAHYPMGPKLRLYLGISEADYRGDSEPRCEVADKVQFVDYIDKFYDETPAEDEAQLVDLLDELIAMDLPDGVLRLWHKGRELWTGDDFRGQLAVGIAAMLRGDLEIAEAALVAAQKLLPQEPAPYINLGQIYQAQERWDEALLWLEAGLEVDPNSLRLWDEIALALRAKHGEFFPELLMQLAERRSSWAGLALAADVLPSTDPGLKLKLLKQVGAGLENDAQYLIELTAAMGQAEDYAAIPTLVWRAERESSSPLPWQLYLHAAQAQVALGHNAEAHAQITKARRGAGNNQEALGMLRYLEDELARAQETTH